MNSHVRAALAEMDSIIISKLEHPGSRALDECSCRFLAAFLRATGARKVLEFGSGFSSLIIAREIGALEDNYLLSIDNSAEDSGEARRNFEISGSQARAEFRVARIGPRLYGTRLLLSYSLPKGLLEALGPFDLVLIDSPPHEHIREGIFYDAFNAVGPGGYIILDDANRETEKENVRHWQAAYGDAIRPILLEGMGSGLNVIEKNLDALPAPLSAGDSLMSSLRTLRIMGRALLRRDGK